MDKLGITVFDVGCNLVASVRRDVGDVGRRPSTRLGATLSRLPLDQARGNPEALEGLRGLGACRGCTEQENAQGQAS